MLVIHTGVDIEGAGTPLPLPLPYALGPVSVYDLQLVHQVKKGFQRRRPRHLGTCMWEPSEGPPGDGQLFGNVAPRGKVHWSCPASFPPRPRGQSSLFSGLSRMGDQSHWPVQSTGQMGRLQ